MTNRVLTVEDMWQAVTEYLAARHAWGYISPSKEREHAHQQAFEQLPQLVQKYFGTRYRLFRLGQWTKLSVQREKSKFGRFVMNCRQQVNQQDKHPKQTTMQVVDTSFAVRKSADSGLLGGCTRPPLSVADTATPVVQASSQQNSRLRQPIPQKWYGYGVDD